MSRIGTTPFVLADIPAPDPDGVEIRYAHGRNMSGTHHDEVVQMVRHPDGVEHHYVIMRGISRPKAEAIVMILNAPEV